MLLLDAGPVETLHPLHARLLVRHGVAVPVLLREGDAQVLHRLWPQGAGLAGALLLAVRERDQLVEMGDGLGEAVSAVVGPGKLVEGLVVIRVVLGAQVEHPLVGGDGLPELIDVEVILTDADPRLRVKAALLLQGLAVVVGLDPEHGLERIIGVRLHAARGGLRDTRRGGGSGLVPLASHDVSRLGLRRADGRTVAVGTDQRQEGLVPLILLGHLHEAEAEQVVGAVQQAVFGKLADQPPMQADGAVVVHLGGFGHSRFDRALARLER